MERLFEPLFTTKARGTGLGFAASEMFVEANEGSRLTITLPRVDV
jgi:signal transduction histidine kinase